MRSVTIAAREEGRRLDRYLMKLLPKAPKSLIYRQLRTNGFTLNGKRIHDARYVLKAGDALAIYLSDSQLAEFGFGADAAIGTGAVPGTDRFGPARAGAGGFEEAVPGTNSLGKAKAGTGGLEEAGPSGFEEAEPNGPAETGPRILYEDSHLLILDKPAGLLSQKNTPQSVSLTEIALRILKEHGVSVLPGFRPGPVNRLDRNTSGAVIFPKDLPAAQAASEMIRNGYIVKYYIAVVHGLANWTGVRRFEHFYRKDAEKNRLILEPVGPGEAGKCSREAEDRVCCETENRVCCEAENRVCREAEDRVCCEAQVLGQNGKRDLSLLRIRLITGKSHQIRAQLAQEGLPILGDPKYSPIEYYHQDQVRYGIRSQMLCAFELFFQRTLPPLTAVSGRRIRASLPGNMKGMIAHYFHEEVSAL